MVTRTSSEQGPRGPSSLDVFDSDTESEDPLADFASEVAEAEGATSREAEALHRFDLFTASFKNVPDLFRLALKSAHSKLEETRRIQDKVCGDVKTLDGNLRKTSARSVKQIEGLRETFAEFDRRITQCEEMAQNVGKRRTRKSDTDQNIRGPMELEGGRSSHRLMSGPPTQPPPRIGNAVPELRVQSTAQNGKRGSMAAAAKSFHGPMTPRRGSARPFAEPDSPTHMAAAMQAVAGRRSPRAASPGPGAGKDTAVAQRAVAKTVSIGALMLGVKSGGSESSRSSRRSSGPSSPPRGEDTPRGSVLPFGLNLKTLRLKHSEEAVEETRAKRASEASDSPAKTARPRAQFASNQSGGSSRPSESESEADSVQVMVNEVEERLAERITATELDMSETQETVQSMQEEVEKMMGKLAAVIGQVDTLKSTIQKQASEERIQAVSFTWIKFKLPGWLKSIGGLDEGDEKALATVLRRASRPDAHILAKASAIMQSQLVEQVDDLNNVKGRVTALEEEVFMKSVSGSDDDEPGSDDARAWVSSAPQRALRRVATANFAKLLAGRQSTSDHFELQQAQGTDSDEEELSREPEAVTEAGADAQMFSVESALTDADSRSGSTKIPALDAHRDQEESEEQQPPLTCQVCEEAPCRCAEEKGSPSGGRVAFKILKIHVSTSQDASMTLATEARGPAEEPPLAAQPSGARLGQGDAEPMASGSFPPSAARSRRPSMFGDEDDLAELRTPSRLRRPSLDSVVPPPGFSSSARRGGVLKVPVFIEAVKTGVGPAASSEDDSSGRNQADTATFRSSGGGSRRLSKADVLASNASANGEAIQDIYDKSQHLSSKVDDLEPILKAHAVELELLQGSIAELKETDIAKLVAGLDKLTERMVSNEVAVKECFASYHGSCENMDRNMAGCRTEAAELSSDLRMLADVACTSVADVLKKVEDERARLYEQASIVFPRAMEQKEQAGTMSITEARLFAVDTRVDALEQSVWNWRAEKDAAARGASPPDTPRSGQSEDESRPHFGASRRRRKSSEGSFSPGPGGRRASGQRWQRASFAMSASGRLSKVMGGEAAADPGSRGRGPYAGGSLVTIDSKGTVTRRQSTGGTPKAAAGSRGMAAAESPDAAAAESRSPSTEARGSMFSRAKTAMLEAMAASDRVGGGAGGEGSGRPASAEKQPAQTEEAKSLRLFLPLVPKSARGAADATPGSREPVFYVEDDVPAMVAARSAGNECAGIVQDNEAPMQKLASTSLSPASIILPSRRLREEGVLPPGSGSGSPVATAAPPSRPRTAIGQPQHRTKRPMVVSGTAVALPGKEGLATGQGRINIGRPGSAAPQPRAFPQQQQQKQQQQQQLQQQQQQQQPLPALHKAPPS